MSTLYLGDTVPDFEQDTSIGRIKFHERAADSGLMINRYACVNDMPIKESGRKFHRRLGRRPDDHPCLSELGF